MAVGKGQVMLGAYLSEYILPSRGLFYGDKLPGGKVMLQAWGMREEKIIAGSDTIQDSLSDLLAERGLYKCSLPIQEFLGQDLHALLFQLRIVSRGSDYRFSWTCVCKAEVGDHLDLTKLKTTYAAEGAVEPYEVLLPGLGVTLGLRHLRKADAQATREYASTLLRKNMVGPNDGDPEYIFRQAKRIATINGTPAKIGEALEISEKIRGMDINALQQGIRRHDFGLDLKVKRTCKGCGKTTDMVMPLTPEFFRPTEQDPQESARGTGSPERSERDLLGILGEDAGVRETGGL